MKISIKLDNFDSDALSDSGFRETFDNTIDEYTNTLVDILRNAYRLVLERSNKNESND